MDDKQALRRPRSVRPNTLKDKPSEYASIHYWMYKIFGRDKKCEWCGLDDPKRRYHWANLSGKYLKERSDWARLCVSCHITYDTRHDTCPRGHSYELHGYVRADGHRDCKECNLIRVKKLTAAARGEEFVDRRLTRLSEDVVQQIKELRLQGWSYKRLGEKFGIAAGTAHAYVDPEWAKRSIAEISERRRIRKASGRGQQ